MTTNAADGTPAEGTPVDDQGQNPAGDETTDQGETQTPAPGSLEEALAGLDEKARTKVLGEIRATRREAQTLRSKLNAAEPKVLSAEEKAAAATRTAEERVATLQRTVVRSKVEALAASQFQNPADAERFLDDLDNYLGQDGTVDETALREDLKLLLQERPYLAKAEGRRGPRPDTTQASGANGVPAADPAAAFQSFIAGQLAGR